MKTQEYVNAENQKKFSWRQSDDGWFNTWECAGGNNRAFRIEKDGAPMRETTALKLAAEYCSKCQNKRGCFFYDLYR